MLSVSEGSGDPRAGELFYEDGQASTLMKQAFKCARLY